MFVGGEDSKQSEKCRSVGGEACIARLEEKLRFDLVNLHVLLSGICNSSYHY